MSPWKFSTNYYFSYHSKNFQLKSTRMIGWNDRISYFYCLIKWCRTSKRTLNLLRKYYFGYFQKKSTGTSSKMETGLTTRKPDYLLPGFTPSVSLNIHVNSFVTIPIHLVRVVSSSAAILEVNRLKLLHRSAIFKIYDVTLANEMNGQYFFLMNVYLLKVLQNFQLRHCSCIIILIPRVLFNHVNLQHDDKG